MESEEKKTPNREKDKSSVKFLEKLSDQLLSSNASVRRQAAFNLSWMQEDGLEILKGILFGDVPASTKNAAAYGLRKMHGRMKKMAMDVFRQGTQHDNNSTREVSRNALAVMEGKIPLKSPSKSGRGRKLRIEEIPGKRRPRQVMAIQSPIRQGPLRTKGPPRRKGPQSPRGDGN